MFSWAVAGRATSGSEWDKPLLLPTPKGKVRSPEIYTDQAGITYVIYALPLNEGRGIYLIKSQDGGKTWSDPIQVFDAVTHGWAMVENPQLTSTGDGRLHALFTQNTIAPGYDPVALYYSHSEDGGSTWSEPEKVVEKQVTWSDIIGSGKTLVHRLWQESSTGYLTLWHSLSSDSGATWSQPETITGFFGNTGPTSLTLDSAQQLHLLQLVNLGENDFVLQHWTWTGEGWSSDQGLQISKDQVPEVFTINAGISPSGDLGVIYSGKTKDQRSKLFFTNQPLKIPAVITLPTAMVVTPEATLLPSLTPTLEATPVIELSPTPNPLVTETGANPSVLPNSYLALAFGVIAVILLVGLAIGFRRRSGSGRRR